MSIYLTCLTLIARGLTFFFWLRIDAKGWVLSSIFFFYCVVSESLVLLSLLCFLFLFRAMSQASPGLCVTRFVHVMKKGGLL